MSDRSHTAQEFETDTRDRAAQGSHQHRSAVDDGAPLQQVRSRLLFEFPHASEVIDFTLGDLAGRATIRLRPLLLVGEPGGGKSRFARSIGELLGLHTWRTDALRADGAVFAGTDRRWHTAEGCHPFLAISQGRIANPLVIIR